LAQLALDGLDTTTISKGEKPLVDLLVETGLAQTPRGEVTVGQARKFIKDNAISVNGEKLTDIDAYLDESSGYFNQYHIIKRGKKIFHLIRWK
jgi:tyrosyl-tRNA synthetase